MSAELLALAAQPPSKPSWARLCDAVDDAFSSPEELETSANIRPLLDALSAWPVPLRTSVFERGMEPLARASTAIAVTVTLVDCGAHEIAMLGRAPASWRSRLQRLELIDSELDSTSLGELAGFDEVGELAVGDSDETGGSMAALAALVLPALHTLELSGETLGSLAWLPEASWCPRLQTLELAGDVADASASVVSAAPLSRLSRLDLETGGLSSTGLTALLDSGWVGGLAALRLPEAALHVSEEPAERIGSLARLEELGCMLESPAAARALAGTSPQPWRWLRLAGNVGAEGLQAVLGVAPGLEHLWLHEAGVGPNGAASIGAAGLPLRTLTIYADDLGDASGLDGSLGALETLGLSLCPLSDPGLAALAPQLPQVRKLVLRHCQLGTAGVRGLAAAAMPRLRHLNLEGWTLDVAGATALSEAAWLGSLERLVLNTPAGDRPRAVVRLLTAANLPVSIREDLLTRHPKAARRPWYSALWGRRS